MKNPVDREADLMRLYRGLSRSQAEIDRKRMIRRDADRAVSYELRRILALKREINDLEKGWQ